MKRYYTYHTLLKNALNSNKHYSLMKRVKHGIIVMCLIIFFSQALYSLLSEGRKSYRTLKKFYGLSDDKKRYNLIGEIYRCATKCNQIIPEKAHILFLSNTTNNQLNYDLFLNYYLYPRKLFWLNNLDPYPEVPPKIEDLDHKFLSTRNIEWVILRYPKEYGVNKVVQLESGKPIQSFNVDR